VFGTIGVFLSVPLTMVLIIALDASPLTRPIAILLGPDLEPDALPATDGNSAGAQTPTEQTQDLLAQERQDTQQGQ